MIDLNPEYISPSALQTTNTETDFVLFFRVFTLQGQIGSETPRLTNLAVAKTIQGQREGTLTLASSVALQKFQSLRLHLNTDAATQWQVMGGTTMSLVVIGKWLFVLYEMHPIIP